MSNSPVTSGSPTVKGRFFLQTYGCQMNEYDSDIMAQRLIDSGYVETYDPDEADLAVVNTCSVREHAESKAKSRIGRLSEGPGAASRTLVVAGCMAQRMGEEILKRHPAVDLVIGPDRAADLPELVAEARRRGPMVATEQTGAVSDVALRRISSRRPLQAYITVMTGCNHACSFCIVPLVRGAEKGRPIADVVRDVSMQVALGVREVTLLGQNVDHYRDPVTGGDFADLLEAVDAVPGIWRVRFTTSNPRDMSDRVLEAVRDLPRVCEHLHLPVQSGSDAVLRRMGRGYTTGDYRALIVRARDIVPAASVTTDLIVGFCGESEEDFRRTLALVDEIGFDAAYTFKYSPRPGTPAARLNDDVPETLKAERLARLASAIEASSASRRRADLETVQEMLVETWADGIAKGRTRHNVWVHAPSGRDLTGRLVPVRMTASAAQSLSGELADRVPA